MGSTAAMMCMFTIARDPDQSPSWCAIRRIAPDGILCLVGIPSGTYSMTFDIAGINRGIVLENNLIFGTV